MMFRAWYRRFALGFARALAEPTGSA